MTYEEQSKDREQRLRDRSRKPGESQTSADTRAAASRTTPSHFVPFSVRQAQYGRGKAAKRMAQFQSSTAGQAMGMGGTLENPYGGYDTQNQSTGSSLAPDPIGGGQTQPQPQTQPQAQEFARSMGTTFDPTTGYSRTPFMESARGKSYDPTAEAIEGKKSPSLPTPSGDDVEASFQMPDGTMRTIRANETVKDGFKRARTARPEKESTAPEAEPSARKTGGMTNAAAFSPESAAQKNPMLREQLIERSRPVASTQSQSTPKDSKPKKESKPKERSPAIQGPIAQAKEDFKLVSNAAKQTAKNMAQAYMDSQSSPEESKDKNIERMNKDFKKLTKAVNEAGVDIPPNLLALFERQAKANRVKFSFDKGFYK